MKRASEKIVNRLRYSRSIAIRIPKRARDDAADVAQWRKGKLSGIGLLCELRERGRPKLRKRRGI